MTSRPDNNNEAHGEETVKHIAAQLGVSASDMVRDENVYLLFTAIFYSHDADYLQLSVIHR